MPANTPRHNLPYPIGTDAVGGGDNTLKALAETLDEKIDTTRWSSGLKHVRNIAVYEEGQPSLAGYVVLQTNLTALNTMMRFDFKGYTYYPHSNIIDLTITGYAFAPDNTFYSVDVNNKGTMQFADIKMMVRTSDQKLVIALLPEIASNVWHYPKLAVDVYMGHTEATPAQLAGWTLTRVSTLAAYTLKVTADASSWRPLPLINGWTNYGGGWQTARYRKVGQIVYLQGLLVGTGRTADQISYLPVGYQPNTLLLFATQTDTATQGRCDVDSGGGIYFRAGGVAYFSLSGIQFTADR